MDRRDQLAISKHLLERLGWKEVKWCEEDKFDNVPASFEGRRPQDGCYDTPPDPFIDIRVSIEIIKGMSLKEQTNLCNILDPQYNKSPVNILLTDPANLALFVHASLINERDLPEPEDDSQFEN